MNQLKTENKSSNIVRTATEILFVKNPVATSMGTVLGIGIYGLLKAIPATFVPELINLDQIPILTYPFLGIFLCNLVAILRHPKFDPSIEQGLTFIREMKRSNTFTDEQLRFEYMKLYRRVLEQVQLDEQTRKSLRELESTVHSTTGTETPIQE